MAETNGTHLLTLFEVMGSDKTKVFVVGSSSKWIQPMIMCVVSATSLLCH